MMNSRKLKYGEPTKTNTLRLPESTWDLIGGPRVLERIALNMFGQSVEEKPENAQISINDIHTYGNGFTVKYICPLCSCDDVDVNYKFCPECGAPVEWVE